MKNKLLAIFVIAFTLTATFVSAQTQTEPFRDPRRIAASFLKLGVEARFDGNFDYSVVVADNQAFKVNGSFVASANNDGSLKAITKLVIDGKEVPLAEPLARFPHDKRGKVTGFWLSLTGRSASGKEASYGSFYADALGQGDPINIVLRPGWVETFVPAEPPPGVDPRNFYLKTPDGNIWWYDQYRRGFGVWQDPVVTSSTQYDLIDGNTGEVLGGGIITNFVGSIATRDNPFGTTREKGVLRVNLGKANHRYFGKSDLKFRTEISFYGQMLPALVFAVDELDGGNLSLQVGNLKPYQAVVLVEEVLDDGTTLLLDIWYGDKTGEIKGNTQSSYNQLVVTIVGEKGADNSNGNGFWVNMNRTYPLTGNSGGGEKGVVTPVPAPVQ